ncbi:MAG TPA: hypothetical protein VG722_00755 [Tepidisphaeraceae bacterium]|nr:hypothetical protein [Tepidisphaeraceae bacterium]
MRPLVSRCKLRGLSKRSSNPILDVSQRSNVPEQLTGGSYLRELQPMVTPIAAT